MGDLVVEDLADEVSKNRQEATVAPPGSLLAEGGNAAASSGPAGLASSPPRGGIVVAFDAESTSRPLTSSSRPLTASRPRSSRPVTGDRLRTPKTPGERLRTPMVPHTPNRPETNVMGLDPGAPKEMKEKAADRLEKRLVEMKAKARDRATNAKKGLMAVLNTPFHFVIFRIDKWLTDHVPHGGRYLAAALLCQLFPLAYGVYTYARNEARKCDEPVGTYIAGTVFIAAFRCFVSLFQARRMVGRYWEGQEFTEALGQVWNMAEGEGQLMERDPCFGGMQLNVLVVLGVLADVCWWCFGCTVLLISMPEVCARQLRADGLILLSYQFLSVCFCSMYLDVVLPYFSLEWDETVDLISGKKKSSSDLKREARRRAQQQRDKRLRLKEKANRETMKPSAAVKVAPGGDLEAGKVPWWATGSVAPPRAGRAEPGSESGKGAPTPAAGDGAGAAGKKRGKKQGPSGSSKTKVIPLSFSVDRAANAS